ncbi:MAG: amino acid adenylation protein [Chthoniobacter sp.]|nr:amino acid adenylation protein [Chthoniobacter sp.]
MTEASTATPEGIAIVGLAGRFPGARDAQEFWSNLAAGRDCMTRFTDEQLTATGYDAARVRDLPGYVATRGVIEKPEWFDRAFFNVPPREAEVMDPQQRVFLEVAWEALEDAACDPSRYAGLIGVFAGMSNNTYHPFFLRQRRDLLNAVGVTSVVIGNEKDFLATRLAYKLNLRGPALNIQTACSSSLVSVSVACQNLLDHQCDVALAGGVSVTFPQDRGYFYQDGSMTSPDGWCRPFDERANGTVFSSGAGVVVLKRLADALADGDHIYALIKGHALNNDGGNKVGFAAPSVNGHIEVISLAQAVAGVSPESISYIEAHGTATPLGDPVEIAGLTQVFRGSTDARQFCGLGSVKGNIGHCDAASGIASLIKTALAFQHGQLPPSLHCEQPNPALHLEESPFFLNTTLREWPRGETPRRAGISSFGVGGTNAHLVLEEAPQHSATAEPDDAPQLLVLSAKTTTALEERARQLATHLDQDRATSLADLAFTLHEGRQTFSHRRAIVARTTAEASTLLRAPAKLQREESRLDTPVAFLFPGQGSQYPGMGAQLFAHEPVFRDTLQQCAEVLRPELGLDLAELLFSRTPDSEAQLRETRITQPAIFAISHALARLWQARGVQPAALLGHSVGEFVAATLAGVFAWEDAARLVALRARLTQDLPRGAMLAARLDEKAAEEFLTDPRLALAAINSPKLCVISGPFDAIEALEAILAAQKISALRLGTSHAFHSPMVEPVVAPLAAAVRLVTLNAPRMPIISSVTGERLTDRQATDPQYWAHHLRATVRFSAAATRLLGEQSYALLECGPGQTLGQLIRQNGARTAKHEVAHSIAEEGDEQVSLATALGRLWLAGVPLDWRAAHGAREYRRLALPTYPFERQRYFADLPPGVPMPIATAGTDGEAPPETFVARSNSTHSSAAAEVTPDSQSPGANSDTPAESSLARVKGLLTDLSGIDLGDCAGSASLLDLGFDSLFLSQVALTFTRKFKTKITVRQLLGDLSTLDALAAAIPAEVAAPSPSSPESAPPDVGPTTDEATTHGPFRPLQRDLGTSLTEQQQRWLDAFIGRYNARTGGSKRHTQQNRAHFADPRAAAGFKQQWKEIVYPIVANRSGGSRIWDIDGNEWLDLTLSFGAAMLGHQPPFVVEAIREQLGRGLEIGPTSPLAGEVAALLCEITGMERATFCNTGSEAVTGALRAARTVTGRTKIVYFRESYHGIDNEVLGRRAGNAVRPVAPGIPDAAVADTIILEYGDSQSLAVIAAQADDIAAVIVEPVQSRHPALQPREFLHQLRALTEQRGIALIFDEIISGFRCHLGGAQAYFGVRADLATYGKVLGGGLPIGALVGRAEYMDAFDGGAWNFGDDSFPGSAVTFFAGTFVRHPLALAAARAVLTHLKEHGPALQQTLAERAGRMIDGINGVLEGSPFSAQRFASNWLVLPAPDFKYSGLLFALLRHRGLHIWENRPCFVSTAHNDADLERVVAVFEESVAELESAGFFSRTKVAAVAEPGAMPITEAQQEIWMVCQQSETASTSFNETWTLLLDGALETEALRHAIDAVVDRHESLRGTVDRTGETMTIAPALKLEIPLVDLSTLDEAERTSQFTSLRAAEGKCVFALERGPLVAMQIVRLAPEKHALVFNAHHVICDGWSCDVFLNELAALYSGAQSLPAPMTMREYERFVHELRETPEYAADRDYWVDQYRTIPPTLTLPGDRPYPRQRSFRGASEQLVLPAEFSQRLARFGAQHGATLVSVLLAGFKTLLFRLSGQDDLAVGMPCAGQNLAGGDHLIGHCVNMLPVRSQLRAEQTFIDLLKSVQGNVLDAFEHQRITFGSLLRQLSFSREPGRVPLIPVIFNVDPPLSHIQFAGLEHRLESNPRSAYQFDLGVNCDTTARGFRLICNYNTDLFDSATILRWLDQYVALLEGASSDPTQPLKALPLERTAIPVQPNGARDVMPLNGAEVATTPSCRSALLHELFAERAAQTPDAIALVCADERVSYRELDRRADELAIRLQAEGVGPEVLVGLCLERSIDLLVGVLGILKAGGAYVPIDLAYPPERVAFILEDSRAPILVTDSKTAERLSINGAQILCLDALPPFGPATSLKPVSQTPDSLAYVIYTSGSTGQPKGCCVTHRNVVRLFESTKAWFEFGAADVWTLFHSVGFDFSVWEIWGALLYGGRLVVVPYLTSRSPEEFHALLVREQVTILNQTPSAFRQLIEADAKSQQPLALRTVIFGGEALEMQSLKPWFERHGDQQPRLVNMYGITETTVHVTYRPLTAADVNSGSVIGTPIPDLQLYVLDENRQRVTAGTPGELYVAGAGLARGYLHRPELTAERFPVHPFAPGERIYKTGDRVRMLANGDLEYLGRLDQQVKIRGFRIELGEIESALLGHSGVREAVVVARDEAEGGKRLVAYVVPRGNTPLNGELREHLLTRLPDYMVPAAFVSLSSIPLTPHGKTDLRALPEARSGHGACEGSCVPPRNAVEEAIAAAWQELLQLDRASVDDDFFLVGGHSLLAIRLIARIRERFGVDVPVQCLFEAPTIRGLADFVSAALRPAGTDHSEHVVTIQRGDASRPPLFLIPGGWGGEIEFLVYAQVARHLDPAQPILGLRARGANTELLPDKTVEELAADFVADMCAVHPEGPYLLGGECVGGIVAYEMARQITAAGKDVALLVLLGAEWPNPASLKEFVAAERKKRRTEWWEAHIRDPALGHWHKLGKLSWSEKCRYVWQRLRRGTTARVPDPAVPEREVLTEYPRKLMAHAPKPHPTKVTLLVDEQAHRRFGALGWDKSHPGELEVHILPGDHISYIREHAPAAGAKLREVIDRASFSFSC